jgi:hypothetical protein
MFDDGIGARGGCFASRMGNFIGDTAVNLVTDSGEHGVLASSYGEGDALFVESCEIGFRATASHE